MRKLQKYAHKSFCSLCPSLVNYGNNKITQDALQSTVVSLQNVDAGHYTEEEEEEWGFLDDNHSCTKEQQNSFAEYHETNC